MLLSLPSASRVNSLLPTTPEAASAGCELVTSDGRALALVSACLVGEAQGGLARLVLEQRFENPYSETLKVTYRMPLPADGAVSGYEFEIGSRVVKGVIDKKRQARERFERAIVEGRTAALLEQERADIFTQQIGNIPPREAVLARITIDQRLVWLPEGEWELRFPTVIGPRYIGSADTAADVRATHVKVTDKPTGITIQIALAIRDAITAGARPFSPSHTLEQRGEVIELHSGARLDRDIVVRWPVATPAPGLSLACARPGSGNDAYGLLTIVPPAKEAHPVAVARDLIVLLDTSGSMSGGPLDTAKQVVCMMIDSLDEQDRLELIEFSNSPRRYLQEPVQATAKAKQAAIHWVRSRAADGGTEMRAGVIEALQTLRVGAQRQVVVVTDGYVGGEHQILEALNRRLPKSCRLHVLGVGSAVNRSLATSLARAGRGVEVIVGLDEDAERGAKRLLDRTKSPMLTNVEVSGSAVLRHAPAQMPDVFAGAPLVCALALRPEGGEILVRGQLARDSWEHRITVPPQRAGEGNQAIVALYGRERVADVEANAMFQSSDGEVEDLGLTFQIATRMTSWVAIDEIRRETSFTREQIVPQELPYGTTASAFGLRGGGAPQMQTRAGSITAEAVDMLEQTRGLAGAGRSASFDDIGESAPSEIFGEDDLSEGSVAPPAGPAAPRSIAPRPAPPAPGFARRVSGGSPPRPGAPTTPPPAARPPAAPSGIRTQSGVYRDAPGDEFESEEPTGQVTKESEQAEEKARAPRPTEAAPMPAAPAAMAQRAEHKLEAEPEAKADVEDKRAPEAAKVGAVRKRAATGKTVMLGAPSSEAPPALGGGGYPQAPEELRASLAPAKPQQLRKKAPNVWLVLLALLAAIAFLIWWLAR